MANLKEICKFTQLINDKDSIIIDSRTEEQIDKSSISHFLIIFDGNYIDEAKKQKPKTRGRKRKSTPVKEEEFDVIQEDENNVQVSDEDARMIIAKQLKIVDNGAMLSTDGWFICPVMKDSDSLRAMNIIAKKDYYELVISDYEVVHFDKPIFTEENLVSQSNWNFNAIDIVAKYCYNHFINGIQIKAIFRHKKDRYNTESIRLLAQSTLAAQRDRIKRGNSLINSLFLMMGKKNYRNMKENLATENDKIDMDKLNGVKTLDYIVDDFKAIERKREELGIKQIKDDTQFAQFKTLFIPTYTMYALTKIYLAYVDVENYSTKCMVKAVRKHPYWNRYLVRIKGCAEISAAYLIAYLDPYMTQHASGFIRYCGMDVVNVAPKKPDGLEPTTGELFRALKLIDKELLIIEDRANALGLSNVNEANYYLIQSQLIGSYQLYQYLSDSLSDMEIQDAIKELPCDTEKIEQSVYADKISMILMDSTIQPVLMMILSKYDLIDTINREVQIKKRARSMSDKVMTPYLDKSGNVKIKASLGYNTELKRRIIGIMGGNFVKQKGYYGQLINDYKEAKMKNPHIAEKVAKTGKAHLHAMAVRYACQIFLLDYYMAICAIENIPNGGGTYMEAKLGRYHRNGMRPAPLSPDQATEQSNKLDKGLIC